MHAHLKINGGALMLSDHFPEYGNGVPIGQLRAPFGHGWSIGAPIRQ